MPNLDAVTSRQGSSASVSQTKVRSGWLSRNWDLLAVLLLFLGSLPLAWISPTTVIAMPHPGSFDDHWVLDATYKVTHHIYFGRDVAFLYGPLAHWLMAAPPRLAGFDLHTVYSSYRTLLLWCSILFSYFALRLLLPEQPAWKRFLLLLLLGIFWTSWDGRTALGILCFATFLHGWSRVRDSRLGPVTFAVGASWLTAFAFWYSADTGVYSVAAFLLSFGGVFCENLRDTAKYPRYLAGLATFGACFVVLVFAVNLVIAGLMDFRFWQTSLALVSVHRWNEPAAMTDAGAMHLLLPFVIGTALFLLRLVTKGERQRVFAARIGFLLGAYIFALLSMQSGLVRSDPNHIIFGVFPMVFFSGVILFSFTSRAASVAAAAVSVAGSLYFSEPINIFQPDNLRYRLARMRHPITSCPAGTLEFEKVCYPSDFGSTLLSTTAFLQQHSNDRQPVLIYPYQFLFGVAAHRDVAGSVEQSFLANGAYLSKFELDGMKRDQAPVGLFFRDAGPRELTSPTLSLPIDDVSNFTRTPGVFFWIFRNYRAEQTLSPGQVGLLRDETRAAKITEEVYPLGVPLKTYNLDQADTTIHLGAPTWPAGADFLRLRMKVKYSPLWKLRKPEALQLEITGADGSRSLRTFVMEPGVSTDVWFYPWDESDLTKYFEADESRWRDAYRPPITNLRLLVSPFDWFSQKASSIEIESADGVKFGLTQ
jgi:hypothetical protein